MKIINTVAMMLRNIISKPVTLLNSVTVGIFLPFKL